MDATFRKPRHILKTILLLFKGNWKFSRCRWPTKIQTIWVKQCLKNLQAIRLEQVKSISLKIMPKFRLMLFKLSHKIEENITTMFLLKQYYTDSTKTKTTENYTITMMNIDTTCLNNNMLSQMLEHSKEIIFPWSNWLHFRDSGMVPHV